MTSEHNGFREQLRGFVTGHREGWTHHDWLELLAQLTDAGVDTSNPDAIGTALEQERVLAYLEALDVKGLGPRRREAVAERFPRLWDLKHASVDALTEIPTFHRGLAKALHNALR